MLCLRHYVSLRGFGGVERHCARLLAHTAAWADIEQHVVVCSKGIHPHHRRAIGQAKSVRGEKTWRSLRLPRFVRTERARWIAEHPPADVALLWNRMGQQRRVLQAVGAERCVYWAHGSAWLPGEEAEKHYLADHVRATLCNSKATQRMLQLRWRYQGQTRVLPCAIAPPARPSPGKSYPRARRLRIGVAARLTPLKGTVLAIHTLHELRAAGLQAELWVAGDGPELPRLRALAAKLALDGAVHFLGLVQDMEEFFEQVDLLLHPVLREPFGIVCIEAGARGCPVVATEVDGLPEVVIHDRTGLLVRPHLPAEQLPEFGGDNGQLPPLVYDPREDCLAAPRFCAPAALAEAVLGLCSRPPWYEQLSANAAADVAQRFDLDRHARDLFDCLRCFAATGGLS